MTENQAVPPIPLPPESGATPPVAPEPAPVAPPAPSPYVAPGGYAAPGAPAAPYTGAPQPGPAQGLAIAAMICGISGVFLSFFSFGFFPALAGVILGHIAQKKQPYAKPFWLTGVITGYVGIAISLIYGLILLAAILLPLLLVGASGDFS